MALTPEMQLVLAAGLANIDEYPTPTGTAAAREVRRVLARDHGYVDYVGRMYPVGGAMHGYIRTPDGPKHVARDASGRWRDNTSTSVRPFIPLDVEVYLDEECDIVLTTT